MAALLAIDQGTTSTRAIAFGLDGKVLAVAQKELPQIYPQQGWVEHDANQIWQDMLAVGREVVAQVPDIAAMGITNQRETTVVWDRETGEPVYNAIVWQDRRGATLCERLRNEELGTMIQEKTGLVIDPYFSATKLAWILNEVPGVRARAEKGELAFGTIDSFLLWKLTGEHLTDATNASRTMLYNLTTGEWDEELLDFFGVPRTMLPGVCGNDGRFGGTTMFGRGIAICGMAGDQQAALIGQACFSPGMVKSTYGTGCFALVNIGGERKTSGNRLLTTIGYRLQGGQTYALEGSIFIAGAAVGWLRDGLKMISNAVESEALAIGLSDNRGVYLVPAFTGLGAPYWDPYAKGAVFGLTRDSGKAEFARAALESVGYQTRDLMGAMRADSGVDLARLRVDGGMVKNDWLCQYIADMLDRPVERPVNVETTAWGAACCAALGAGIFTSLTDVEKAWMSERVFEPRISSDERAKNYGGWKRAVAAVRMFHDSI